MLMEKEGKFKDNQRHQSSRSIYIPDESRSINSTKYDSLNNILIPNIKPSRITHNINDNTNTSINNKTNNFFQALKMLKQGKSHINHTRTHMSEFSETNANNSKEEKVIRYLNNPITKNVIKDGNQLKVSFHKQFTTSINVPYKLNTIFETFLSNIVEIGDDCDDDDCIVNNNKYEEHDEEICIPSIQEKQMTNKDNRFYKGNNNKASTADYTDHDNNNNYYNSESFSSPTYPEVKPFSLQIIDDLDELKEVNVSDYKNSTIKKFPCIDNGNIGTEIFIADSIMSNERYNHININKCLYSQSEDKHYYNLNKSQNELIMSLKQKTTEKKIPQKYYRRELVDSLLTSNSIAKSNKNINTNLIDKFNKCDDENVNNKRLNESIINHKENYKHKGEEGSDNEISINNVNNISIDAQMIDFITDNDSYDSVCNNKLNKNSNNNQNLSQRSFNALTPIRHIDFNNEEDIYNTPKDKRKAFRLPIPTSTLKLTISSTSSSLKRKSINRSNDNAIDNPNDNKDEEGQTVYDLDFINNLLARDSHYKAKPNYIANHPKLKWSYRSTLIDWLMEISEEFAFKRDTFHYAINYIDRYLSRVSNCEKKFLQLLGITCLGIAAKIEEVQIPKLIEYAKATDESYTDIEIIDTEKRILKTLQWEIIPITLNTWMNWYICQWDLFLDTFDDMISKLSDAYSNDNVVYFKRPDDKAYYNYRKIAQIVDLCALSELGLNYNSRALIASGILMVLILNYDLIVIDGMTLDELNEEFYYTLLQKNKEYIEVYKDFIKQSFNFNWEDPELITAIVYAGKFIKYNFKYDVPLVYQVSSANIENGNYEDFVSYQTYNEQNLGYLEMITNYNK